MMQKRCERHGYYTQDICPSCSVEIDAYQPLGHVGLKTQRFPPGHGHCAKIVDLADND